MLIFHLAFYLAFCLAFHVSFVLTFYLAFFILAGILFDIQSNILPGILSGILSDILAGMCSGPCVPSCTLSLRQGSAHIQTYPAGGFQGFRGAVESTARVDPREVSDRSKVALLCRFDDVPWPSGRWHPNISKPSMDWNRKPWIFSQKYGLSQQISPETNSECWTTIQISVKQWNMPSQCMRLPACSIRLLASLVLKCS